MSSKVAIATLSVGLTAAVAGFTAWRHLTRLPEWHDQPTTEIEAPPVLSQQEFDESTERVQLESGLRQKLTAPADQPTAQRVRFDEQAINELIVVSVNQSQETQPYLDGVKGIKTEISEQHIKSEIVINFSEVNRDRLPEQHVQVLEDLAAQFPLLADKDILLSFDGKPQIINGKLQLDPAMKAAIGGFQMVLADFIGHFGVDLSTTPIDINLSDLDIQQVQYAEGELIITGKEKQG